MARPRKVWAEGELHPNEIAAELGITLKQARGLVLGFRVGMTPLARQVMINQTLRDWNMSPLTKSILTLERSKKIEHIAEPSEPISIRQYKPRIRITAVQCSLCDERATAEAKRFRLKEWEPVCQTHAAIYDRDCWIVKFRKLPMTPQEAQSLWNRASYERHVEKRRKERLAAYHSRKVAA
jgi:hypothetical protein